MYLIVKGLKRIMNKKNLARRDNHQRRILLRVKIASIVVRLDI
jgi:hypothetical protein